MDNKLIIKWMVVSDLQRYHEKLCMMRNGWYLMF